MIPLDRLGDYTDGIERINIELSLKNKLRLAFDLEQFLASPLFNHAWPPDSDTRPPQEIVDAKAEEARALVTGVRELWQDWLDRLDTTFPALQDHSLVASWKTQLQAPLAEIFSGLAFVPVMKHVNDIHARVLRSRVFVALHMHAGDGNVHTNIPVNSDDYGLPTAGARWWWSPRVRVRI